MTGDVFVDTNVFVYDQDCSAPVKQRAAHEWLRFLWTTQRGRTGAQALSEYYTTVTRKLKPGRDPALAREDVRDLQVWRPVPVDVELVTRAWGLEDRFFLSWWDALIVAAAQTAGCGALLTEDLQDGQELEGLLVVDPFRHSPDSL
jgi:predicted nucleic acid-binding protein